MPQVKTNLITFTSFYSQSAVRLSEFGNVKMFFFASVLNLEVYVQIDIYLRKRGVRLVLCLNKIYNFRLLKLEYLIWDFLFQLGFFIYYSVSTGELNPAGPVPIDSIFIYRPDKRIEIWRFLLYMMLHAG